MAIIPSFGVLDVLLVGLPKSLNPPGALVLVPHIVSPGALNTSSHIVPVSISHRLQCKELKVSWSAPHGETAKVTEGYRLWVLDKRLGNAHLPLILRDPRVRQDLLTPGFRVSLPRILSSITGVWRKQVKPLHHLFERVPVREACASDTDVLLQTKVFNLVEDRLVIEFGRGAVLIGFDRADVRGLGTHEVFDQSSSGSLRLYLIRLRTRT